MTPPETFQIGSGGAGSSSPSATSSATKLAQFIIERFRLAKSKRATWDGHWQDLKELVRPDTLDFNRQMVPGYRRYDLVYDGTAIDANEELAAGLHSYLTSPTERWFELGIQAGNQAWEYTKETLSDDALEWLEETADMIYQQYSYSPVQFNSCVHEGYLDLGAFGSMVLYQEWTENEGGHLLFKSFPLADCYYMENADGLVDTLFRYFTYSGRQIVQEWGEANIPPKLMKAISDKGGLDRDFRIIALVCPRTDRDVGSPLSSQKKFMSAYVAETTQEVISESGYDSFCYHISRWLKIAGEVYGRGPAMKCLPDIKSLNMLEKTVLRASQKAIDPPLQVPDDGFLLPIKTAPGSLIFKEPGTEKIEPLEFKGNLQFGIEYPNQKRDYIRKCFHGDWLKMGKDNKEMTAYETAERRDEMLRMMAPMLGRQQTEFLGPMLARSYELLRSHGMIRPAPTELQKKRMMVAYISPAARAQQGVKAQSMSQFVQDLVPLAQVDQSVIDVLDMDKVAAKYALIRGVPRTVLRSPEAVAKIRQGRQAQQAAQQMAGVAEPASKALLNVSKVQNPGA